MTNDETTGALVTVHEAWGETDAELIRSVLKAEGIDSFLSNFPQTVYPMTVDGLGRIEIRVAAKHVERAAELINAQSDAQP